jgi:acylphosphatase
MVDDRQTLKVRIKGRVQGVSFRYWTLRQAERLGLTGWVRNEDDGSVLALISGPQTAVLTMVERFWKGPSAASVSSVEMEPAALAETPAGFRIID